MFARSAPDRQRLAGQRGLVELALPALDAAVAGDPLAGADQDEVTGDELRCGDLLLLAGRAELDGALGGEVQQCPDAGGGALGHHRFQRTGGGEDDDQQGAVEDLPDRCGRQGGDDHQHVDVQGAPPKCLQPGQTRLPAPAA